MKRFLFVFVLFVSVSVSAQEYWNRKDFEISDRNIDASWKALAFNWQKSNSHFDLPDGTFLNISGATQSKQIDMIAAIDRINAEKEPQREINLGSPLGEPKEKKKRFFELTGNADPGKMDTYINPFVAPILDPYNRAYYQLRSNSLYRYNY
ncbi:hypothetical protein C7S20_17690 [Christiangramia fulva]|uniref:Peptidase n=1 Tax=Christiangramia fulva TaxID=2126553 RepID=A0A2R3Z9T6_9FLAO|nr:hypothetical protein [Christiangramia fulva]AVR46942.1 hypothetical protein C7S20_17690 [Christiangramia fulva]